MPTSGPGSERRRRASGFTLIELLVVVAIIALTAGLVAVTLRDGSEQRLERDGLRLALLMETARAESRATGMPVWWRPAVDPEPAGFRFVGLTSAQALPSTWLDPETRAAVEGAASVQLGPEAILAPQRVRLRLGERQLVVATDGLGPFEVVVGATP